MYNPAFRVNLVDAISLKDDEMELKRRQNILAILLVFVVGIYVAKKELSYNSSETIPMVVFDFQNKVTIDSVEFGPFSSKLYVSYSYNGKSGENPKILITPQFDNPNNIVKTDRVITARTIKTGNHKDVFQIVNPCRPSDKCSASEIQLKIVSAADYREFKRVGNNLNEIPHSYSKVFKQPLEWIARSPTKQEKKKFENIDLVIWYLDSNKRSNFRAAKKILDKIFVERPEDVQAYIELARYHMKISWSEIGLRRAEEALNAAYSLAPGNANVFVLRGYVYTHQKKYELAKKDFQLANELGTDNLWLLANRGELEQLLGNEVKALEYYQSILNKERKGSSPNDRARLAAFMRIQDILMSAGQLEDIDQLLEKKVRQFPDFPCYLTERAQFKLNETGDFKGAIELARSAISSNCQREKFAKEVYADSLVADWYTKTIQGKPAESSYINAVALDANWSKRIYRFAQKEKLRPVLIELLKSKLKVDEVDTRNYTALAYATADSDSIAVRELIKLGSDPNKLISDDYSVFFLSLISSDEATIKAFLNSGIKLDKKFQNGITVEQILQERGFGMLVSNENI